MGAMWGMRRKTIGRASWEVAGGGAGEPISVHTTHSGAIVYWPSPNEQWPPVQERQWERRGLVTWSRSLWAVYDNKTGNSVYNGVPAELDVACRRRGSGAEVAGYNRNRKPGRKGAGKEVWSWADPVSRGERARAPTSGICQLAQLAARTTANQRAALGLPANERARNVSRAGRSARCVKSNIFARAVVGHVTRTNCPGTANL